MIQAEPCPKRMGFALQASRIQQQRATVRHEVVLENSWRRLTSFQTMLSSDLSLFASCFRVRVQQYGDGQSVVSCQPHIDSEYVLPHGELGIFAVCSKVLLSLFAYNLRRTEREQRKSIQASHKDWREKRG